jgi:hypothetical protein
MFDFWWAFERYYFFHLAELDAQIVVNHSKLDELHERIERTISLFSKNLLKKRKNVNVANEGLYTIS